MFQVPTVGSPLEDESKSKARAYGDGHNLSLDLGWEFYWPRTL